MHDHLIRGCAECGIGDAGEGAWSGASSAGVGAVASCGQEACHSSFEMSD